ncbi:MAG: Peptide deformylase [Pseudomonadota bacterium]
MTVREILKMGDERLLRKAQAIEHFNTPELLQGIADMKETMLAANGAGLAAPQIGWDVQLVMFGTGQVISRYPDAAPIPFTVLINPIITPLSDEEQNDWEGCLSVPGLRAVVPRWQHIRYTGFDEKGEVIDRTADGFHAKVVQHECDHLVGILYPHRIRDFSKFGFNSILFPNLAPEKAS